MTIRVKKSDATADVPIKGATYARLRAYCRRHGTQMRTVVDGLINQALDAKGRN